MSLKENLVILQSQYPEWGNKRLAKAAGCAPNTVKYHLRVGEVEKTRQRLRRNRQGQPLARKARRFIDTTARYGFRKRLNDFKRVQRSKGLKRMRQGDTQKSAVLVAHLLGVSTCYLTGREIDFNAPSSYSLDHIVPACRGGGSEAENCGLACKDANVAKGSLLVGEFLKLCEEVLTHHGYTVMRPALALANCA